MNYDSFDTVINGEDTYEETARVLLRDGKIVYPWTDEKETQLDILFTYQPTTCFEYGLNCHMQGGVRVTDLFVSIMRVGAFAFQIDNNDSSPEYIAEKFRHHKNYTIEKLTDLINGVRKEIAKQS